MQFALNFFYLFQAYLTLNHFILDKTPNLKIRHPFGAKIPITTENFSPTVRKWIENQSPLSAGA